MTTVRVSRGARKDLRTILRFLAENGGLGPAADFSKSIDQTLQVLAVHPLAYAEKPELGHAVRGAIIGSYLVIYRYRSREDEVAILRVLHGRRQIGRDFRRLT